MQWNKPLSEVKRARFRHLLYTVTSFYLVMLLQVYPTLALGDKVLLEHDQILEAFNIFLIVISSLILVINLIFAGLGIRQTAQNYSSFSPFAPAMLGSFAGAIFTLIGSEFIGQLTPTLSTLVGCHGGMFLVALIWVLLKMNQTT